MYYVAEGTRDISVHPRYLDSRYDEHIEDTLRQQLESHCTQELGYVVCVLKILHREKGRIQDGTGMIVIRIKYQAIVFIPHRGLVLDGVVTDVNELGFFTQCGPLKAFVSAGGMPITYKYQKASAEFHSEQKGGAEGEEAETSTIIHPQSEIRLRLQGVRYDSIRMFAIATIDGDYLGTTEEDANTKQGDGPQSIADIGEA